MTLLKYINGLMLLPVEMQCRLLKIVAISTSTIGGDMSNPVCSFENKENNALSLKELHTNITEVQYL